MHTSAVRGAITRFNLPAMSPTMTEGVIHKWMKKEGESFTAGEVLIELETDKAQIDVEAQDDGVLAKIILKEGQKAPVNTLIGLLAEESDDISNVQIPESEDAPAKAEEAAPVPPPTQTKQPEAPTKSIDHGAIDTKQLKKPLSPAVLSLVLKHHITDVSAIKATGPGGRILKGDVLAHIGQIAFRPAPKFNNSAAPPRDQIVFAKVK
ncbi:PDH complex E3BP [Phycomyces blakesleeanus NRRL 1555(-)]|uniref:PDH complex E3BP n=1 Tax=Phycomyces blakesleeanus (strain ATCC 8743b / DSM 1359 / FGSC 10004 / NBRC 33097 / NRRL 1555) TaxID=763407 RepID=A0A163CUP1_PHYB8|nr:PDH complex E3BP [Phycomyces blakesleeanus NRRL 1555(-)]OAD65710.1 PDH complex E3BP [Phycomyces blakesleeanus NRRL 1555(-)]|eukprot:XP_018283750.1 PDH complex E3BP [Phycomyces blakesleeanus NRRL 1555(-)]